MGKSTFFTGQPVLNQLLSLLDRQGIRSIARSGEHDRYYRYFDTYTYLVTMLPAVVGVVTNNTHIPTPQPARQSPATNQQLRQYSVHPQCLVAVYF